MDQIEGGILNFLKNHGAAQTGGRRGTAKLPRNAWQDRLVKGPSDSRREHQKESAIPRIPVNRVFKEGMVYVTEENYRKLEKFLKPGELELS